MSFKIQWRTNSTETLAVIEQRTKEFWYEDDNNYSYASVEDAEANSEIVKDWRAGPSDLTAVRLKDLDTGLVIYINPRAKK
jgi:hypothetical protein